MTAHREMDKLIAVDPYHEVLFSNRKNKQLIHETAWMNLKQLCSVKDDRQK